MSQVPDKKKKKKKKEQKFLSFSLQVKKKKLFSTPHKKKKKKRNMSCSAYGVSGAPGQYASYPEYQASFYQQPCADPYNNLTSITNQQNAQLNLRSLMPASWDSNTAAMAMSSDPKDDWNKYSVTRDATMRYISASGANRFRTLDRSSTGRRFGTPNLLRSQPPAALTVGSSPWFNDSSDRQALVSPQMRPWIGCGTSG